MGSLLLTLIAHMLADFLLQSRRMVAAKNCLHWTGFVSHGCVVFLVSFALLAGYRWPEVLLYSLMIAVSHLGIDLFKMLVTRNRSDRTQLVGFIADQGLHFLMIIGVWQWFVLTPDSRMIAFFSARFAPRLVTVFKPGLFDSAGWGEQALCYILGYLLVCWGGAILIQKFLQFLEYRGDEKAELQKTGNYIGIIERALILTLVLNNSLTAVAFIFTAKSIARYSELNNRDFAEYYLVGTLLSTALAVGGGLAVSFLCKFL